MAKYASLLNVRLKVGLQRHAAVGEVSERRAADVCRGSRALAVKFVKLLVILFGLIVVEYQHGYSFTLRK